MQPTQLSTPAGPRSHLVDLRPFRDETLRLFSGRSCGEAARASAGLDRVDHDPGVERVVVQVPDDTWDVSTSFWLGMFGDSVRALRADGFRTRYEFRGGIPPEDVDAGIEDALCEEDPLAAALDIARWKRA